MAFSASDQYVITVGGRDQAVLVWETDIQAAAAGQDGGAVGEESA